MSNKFTPADVAGLVQDWMDWLEDNRGEHVMQFLAQHDDVDQVEEVQATTADFRDSACILAVFTARAALRKFRCYLFSRQNMQIDDSAMLLRVVLAESEDAINNCNNALYHLTAKPKSDSAESSAAESTEGGVS